MPCPACGAEQATDLASCPKCSEKPRRRGRRSENAAEGDVPLGPRPPLNNPRAMSAYRYGVYGLIPFAGLVLGPLALGSGILEAIPWLLRRSIRTADQSAARLQAASTANS